MKNNDFEQLKEKVDQSYELLLEDPYEEVFDALDVSVYSNLDKEFLGARVALSLGGPNIYLDTSNGLMEGYWGNEEYTFKADDSLVIQVNDILEQHWDSN